MIVESMNDSEFVLEVMRDFFEEMRDYVARAMVKKRSKRGMRAIILRREEIIGI
jgi:hypothetical protein